MKISVIVPTHNRAEALGKTLSHLARQDFDEPWEVIVVNNRSTDNTDAVVQSQQFPVPLQLVHEDTPGAAAARNAGVEAATGQYLLFIDNDILVEPDFIQRHHQSLMRYPGCWIVGHIVALPEHETTPFGKYRKTLSPAVSTSEELADSDGLTGANFSMPRADMKRLGGFDEKFDVASHEDLELAMRAWNVGIRILFDPSIVGVHNDWAGSAIGDYCTRQRMYCRTEPLFWGKYGESYRKQELVKENLPPDLKADGPKLFTRKIGKRLIGSPLGQSSIIGLCRALEAAWPWRPALWRLYRVAIAGAMYKGFQEGLHIFGDDSIAARQSNLVAPARAGNHSTLKK